MEGEVDRQMLVPAIFRHPGQFHEPRPLLGKRDLSWQSRGFGQPGTAAQNPGFAQPETSAQKPGLIQPGTSVRNSGLANPGMSQPGTSAQNPGLAQPATSAQNPGLSQPGMAAENPRFSPRGRTCQNSVLSQPGTSAQNPGFSQPGMAAQNPGFSQLGRTAQNPGLSQPGTSARNPRFSQLGMTAQNPGFSQSGKLAQNLGFSQPETSAQNPGFSRSGIPQNPGAVPRSNRPWNQRAWEWDSSAFVARPSPDGSAAASGVPAEARGVEDEEENLTLQLGGVKYGAMEEPAAAARPSKRVRSGSPGNGGGFGVQPMCQVDDCRADLSRAKDYHRRHKVCEVHSKMTKAVVAKVMQRFCQQCSRFHPLSEFDEGKRSCRRRLAGHNRRRRKTQPEDGPSRSAPPGSQENGVTGGMDITNLLSILARLQGKNADAPSSLPPLPDKEHLLQILNKLQPSPATDFSSRSPVSNGIDLNVSPPLQQGSFEQPSKPNGNSAATSTMNRVSVLSSVLPASERLNLVSSPQTSSRSSGDDMTTPTCVDLAPDDHSRDKSNLILPSLGVPRISCSSQYQSGEPSVQEDRVRLSLQLFGSSEDDSPPKLGSSVKYSSESSNPMEDGQETFPVHSATERRYERMSICREDNQTAEASTSCGWSAPLELFKPSTRPVENSLVQNRVSQAGYASSSGSDRSPSSSTSDAQDRTGRIICKLFDKDPSNLPPNLRSQILNWLSTSPSEMESHIRPGCVVLSVYISMPASAWDGLEENLVQRVGSLLQGPDSDFWRNGRLLLRTSRQLASHKDGKIRLCKSWKTWSSPELTYVSPIAVVSGKETLIVLRGRNLTVPGTKIHCTYMGGYISKEVLGSTCPGTIYDHSSEESFSFPGGSPNVFGRCFIEVDNGFKGNSFPIIIADSSVCRELRGLECEFVEDPSNNDVITEENRQPRSREDVLHFLNELGWLFQNKSIPSSPLALNFASTRFKFLFTFSIERDWSALIRTLLDILAERSIGSDARSQEALEMLQELELLSRAVSRKCRKLVDLLLHYSVKRGSDAPNMYIFPPNLAGPGGLTPLHLAASAEDSEDMVDALTDDPQQVGLHSWDSVKDENGHSPYMYALMRSNHSYNTLVARKLADRKSGQLSITVGNADIDLDLPFEEVQITEERDKPPLQVESCAQCAMVAAGRRRRGRPGGRTRSFLQRSFVRSIIAVAAVCVCVCVFLRGMPKINSIAPFKWENLHYGPR